MIKQLIFGLFLLIPFTGISQSTEEIIQKHLTAIGGEKNWNKINTILIESTQRIEGDEIEHRRQVIRNKAVRSDMIYKGRSAAVNDKKYYILVNQKGGWYFLPGQAKVAPMNAEEILYYKDDLDYEDPFLNYIQKERQITMIGLEYYDDREFYKFSIQYPSGKQEYCYLDSKTFLIDKRVLINAPIEDSRDYRNYTRYGDGIMMPATIITTGGEITITQVQINPVLDEKAFNPDFPNNYRR
ncbi:MAG: hypothetical protein JNJ58_09910 [Chitinophagaceae bacterium]|nr:hypothetical protein [Chitinophagaceae bacterium]